jgi:YhcH/YjgK/YiaL family protein
MLVFKKRGAEFMIIDKVENWKQYNFAAAWQRAFEFLATLTPDSPERRYEIEGDDIFALVMSYKTFAPQSALFESHRDYIDIQSVLSGAEGFECSFGDDLTVTTPYDSAAEAEFYKRIHPGQTRVNVFPGTFVMLYPHDAHRPGLMIGNESELVKKVVVKIRRELLMH